MRVLEFNMKDYPKVYVKQLHKSIFIDTSNNKFKVSDSLIEFDTLLMLCLAIAEDNGFDTISFINE